jgi:CRISPR/Cas system-associated exonuclease Cas4 (RecB family)
VKPLRISPSSFDLFFKCSQQYKWAVIDEILPEEGSDNLYAVLGSSFHKIMELHDRFSFNHEKLKLFWEPIFFMYYSDAKNLPKDTDFNAFVKKGYVLLDNAIKLKKRWENLKVLQNECYFRIEFPNQYIKAWISGKIDLILHDPAENIYTVLDWKTSANVDKEVEKNNQLLFYLYYIINTYHVSYDKVWGCLAYPSSEKLLFTQRTETDVAELFKKITLMIKRISEDDFKKDPMFNFCPDDCHFCPYKNKCQN